MNISKIKVENMESPRSGSPVANQFIITTENGQYFQSYKTIIAFIPKEGKIVLDQEDWNYSVTTSKYRNEFLGVSTQETKANIKNGSYLLADLN